MTVGQRASKAAVLLGSALVGIVLWQGCTRASREPAVADPASLRVTRSGPVVGFEARYNSHAWLGIPYAQPPVGALRWRAPRPPETWSGTRDALGFGAPCVQYASTFAGVTTKRTGTPVGSEDCLFLNVWAPRFSEKAVPRGDARLPVMVWIHGGGNTIGEGGFYNGGNLAATHNLVVVTLNYRLGPFGWFRHAALREGDAGGDDRSGNFGTLDMVRALEWVRDNIEAFGGDPGRVTIFGESAGGTNVYSLLLSPRASGLFHRAVVQSGGLSLRTVAEAEHYADNAAPGMNNSSNEVLARLLIRDGGARDRGEAKTRLAAMKDAEVAGLLRAKSAFEILTAYRPLPGLGMIEMPMVFGDGAVLPAEDPLQRFARPGGYNQVPVMIGTNRDESKLFMFADPAWVRRWFWLVPRLRDERRFVASAEYGSKMWKANGADEPAAAIQATQGAGVFGYRFDWDEEPTVLGADLSVMLGAAHGLEIPFVFGHFDLGREANQIFTAQNESGRQALAAQMMAYWAEFAYAGSPGRGRDGRQPQWLPWDGASPAAPKFIILDTPAGGGSRMSAETVAVKSVLAAVESDPRLPTQKDKCRIYRELAARPRGLAKKDYPNAGSKGCKEFPFDAYPWK